MKIPRDPMVNKVPVTFEILLDFETITAVAVFENLMFDDHMGTDSYQKTSLFCPQAKVDILKVHKVPLVEQADAFKNAATN